MSVARAVPPTPTPTVRAPPPDARGDAAPRKLLQINFDRNHPAPEYQPPDHSWGASFPGKQKPSTQLTLFAVGVKKSE